MGPIPSSSLLSPAFDPWEPCLALSPGEDVPTLTSIEVTVTQTCNLRCAYCAVGETLVTQDGPTIPLDLLFRRLDEVPHLRTLSLTGGEPSFHPRSLTDRVMPLLRYARARGLWTQLNTNLTLPWSRYEPLLEWVSVFHISLNHLDGESFARTSLAHRPGGSRQGAEALYRRMLDNARRLAAAGAFVSAETMISPDTLPRLPQLHRLCAELGVRRQEIHPLYPVDFARHLDVLPLPALRQGIESLLDAHVPGVWLLFGTLPFFWCRADAPTRALLRRLRTSPGVSVRNDPDGRNRLNVSLFTGEVLLSDFHAGGPLGNLQSESLLTIYRRWRESKLCRSLLCRCPQVGCLGPNAIVAATYYPGERFASGEGDAAWRRSAGDPA